MGSVVSASGVALGSLLFLLLFGGRSGWWGFASGNGLGQLAALGIGVEGQAGGASLETGVASDTEPVPHATLLNGHGSVGGVLADGMFLTVWDIVGPIARVDGVVVQKGEGTLLDGRGPVPAVPVSSAGGRVREDPVLPLAVVSALRRLAHNTGAIRTPHSMRVVAVLGESAPSPSEGEAIGTGLEDGLSGRGVALIVVVAVVFVWEKAIVFGILVVSAELLGSCSGGRSSSGLSPGQLKGAHEEQGKNPR